MCECSDPLLCEVVSPVVTVGDVRGNLLEVAPGMWDTGATEGFVFVANPKTGNDAFEAVTLLEGDVVAVVEESLAVQQFCEDCGTTSALCLCVDESREKCKRCGVWMVKTSEEDEFRCLQCGSENVVVMPYQGCEECRPPRSRTSRWMKGAVGFLACTFASVCATAAATTIPVGGSDTRINPVYHIVEEPGRVDLMAEELPTDYYYEKSREKLAETFPEASIHVLDHLEALEAFLDKSICAGFSFGVEKAAVGVLEGKLLGRRSRTPWFAV